MRAAVAQLYAVPCNPEANLAAMESAICDAAASGADVVCFSELFYSGYHLNRAEMERLALYPDSTEIRQMCAMAANNRIYVLVSFPERDPDTGALYIAATLIGPQGTILLHHRKTYRREGEQDIFTAGHSYEICNTAFGKVGILICYEMEFPEPARILTLQGAQVLLVTSAFDETEEMRRYLCALAIQNQCWVVAVNSVQPHLPYRGFSCVVDQYGRVMAGLEQQEQLLFCDIDMTDDRRRTAPHFRELDVSTFSLLTRTAEDRFRSH